MIDESDDVPQRQRPDTVGALEDPLFGDQWHLDNTGQGGGTPTEDVNILAAWSRGGTAGGLGQGVRITIVDDGLETAHEDLAANVVPNQSMNFRHAANGCVAPACLPNGLGATDPNPTTAEDNHGTAVAGVAAGHANRVGGRGSAPQAGLVGYNLLSASPTASQESVAMTHNAVAMHVHSNSWGPPDGTGGLAGSGPLWRAGVETGVVTGRSGRGTVYAWAAGNGGAVGDNSNYDGYANNRHVIAVCAVGANGRRSPYSERGANLWVCAPSNSTSALPGITTTDRMGSAGYNSGTAPDYANANYTKTFGGTSASVPLVAGILALVLEHNPNLGWRDVRLILAETARRNDPADPDWITNGGGYHVNHNYGFGVIDADAAVARALTWTPVGAQQVFPSALRTPNQPIPDNSAAGVSDTLTVSGTGITRLEWVEVVFSASDHSYLGDLRVTLRNMATGTESRLAERHACADTCGPSYSQWSFGTSRHVGEAANGQWRLDVADLEGADTGTFEQWQLIFYGT